MKFLLVIITIATIILLTGINKKQVPQTYAEWQRQHGQKTVQKSSPSKPKNEQNSQSFTIGYKKVFKSKPVPQTYEEWEMAHEKKYIHKKEVTITFEGHKKQKKVPQTYEEWVLKHPTSEEGNLKKIFTKN